MDLTIHGMILFIYVCKPIHSLSLGVLMFDVVRFRDLVIKHAGYQSLALIYTIIINYEYIKINSSFYAGTCAGLQQYK